MQSAFFVNNIGEFIWLFLQVNAKIALSVDMKLYFITDLLYVVTTPKQMLELHEWQ